MADIVNLNRFRKSRDRAEKKAQADENVVKFGRTKAEKARDKDQKKRDKDNLDGHKIDR